MNKLRFVLIIIIMFSLTSCVNNQENDDDSLSSTLNFDNAKYQEIKSKWGKSGKSNYSLEYSISKVEPDVIKGFVNVNNGTGSLDLTISDLQKNDEGYEKEADYYKSNGMKIEFKSINDFFELIDNTVLSRKAQYDKGLYSYYKLSVKYDTENNIPINIEETIIYKNSTAQKGNEDKDIFDDSLNIKISNFKETID